MPKPDLIIDSNERGSLHDSIVRRAQREGLVVIKKSLVVGDYLLGNSCVEAKSINDLFQSSHSGHLWRQLDNMDMNYERFFLLIHGSISKYIAMAKNNGQKVPSYSRVQNELMGTIARIMADFDVQVFFTENTSEAAMFVVKLHDKLHKPASRHGAKALKRVSTNDVRLDMLLSIPGIGMDMGERMLEKCGSIEEMAYPESLREIRGLGEVLRKRVVDVITSEEPVSIRSKK
jgi:DNA excision repair protein ERCC-4|tara:strand:+ start:11224 stop:11919 length:696 start_codon:yes stop_codon:yes gene_type:complete